MKKYKQTHSLSHIFLLTFFVFTSLFFVTGIVYSLITVGIGSSLFLLCSTGFITCTMFSAYSAYAIHKGITRSRALKKGVAYDIDKKPKNSEAKLENLIDLNDPNEKHNTQHSKSEISEETLTPEVVKPDNLISHDFKLPTHLNNRVTTTSDKQHLKSPSQTQGTSFGAISASSTNKTTNQQLSSTPQLQKSSAPLLPSTHKVNAADKSKQSLQPQSTSNQIVVPTPPPMPPATYDISKVLPQSPNIINKTPISIAALKIKPSNELSTTLQSQNQIVEQDSSNKQNDIEHDKEKTEQQSSTESQTPPLPPPPMPEDNLVTNKLEIQSQETNILLNSIREFDIKSLKKHGDTKVTCQSNRDKVLNSIRNFNPESLKKTKQDIPNENQNNSSDNHIKTLKSTSEPELMKGLEEVVKARAPAFQESDDEDDDRSTSSEHKWSDDDEEYVNTSPKVQNNKSAKNYVKSNNHDDSIDSSMGDCDSSPEKVNNNTERTQKPNTLLCSSLFFKSKERENSEQLLPSS